MQSQLKVSQGKPHNSPLSSLPSHRAQGRQPGKCQPLFFLLLDQVCHRNKLYPPNFKRLKESVCPKSLSTAWRESLVTFVYLERLWVEKAGHLVRKLLSDRTRAQGRSFFAPACRSIRYLRKEQTTERWAEFPGLAPSVLLVWPRTAVPSPRGSEQAA